MSTTKAFEIPTSVKAANIKKRFQPSTDAPKGAPSPTVKDDLIARIGTANRHDISDGFPITIDVQPDFRWVFMCIMYYANLYYSSIDIKNKAKTSPATVAMYFITIIHAHLLVSDLFLRHTPSFWANQFMNDSARREYLEFLLSLPVPEILMKFIETLTETSDPRRPHVQYCPSFAGFSLYHDIPRLFPARIFLTMHNLCATVTARSETDAVYTRLYQTLVFPSVTIGNIFGQHVIGTSNILDTSSKLVQSMQSLFNPIVERSIARRNTFAPTPSTNYDQTDKRYFNPYIYLLHAIDTDITEMTTVLESVSSALSSVLPFSGQLGSIYDKLQGLDITRHAYSSFSMPTHCYGNTTAPTTGKPLKTQNSKERATTLNFLQDFTPTNGTEVKFPTASTITSILYLVKDTTKTENFPSPTTDFRKFSPKYDVSPRLRVLDPYDVNVSVLHTTVICGLIIESFEIDGSIVLQPDVEATLDECNSQVLQSAVPLSAIRRATTTDGSTTTARYDAVQRVQHLHSSQKAGISLYDAGEHRLGVFDKAADEAIVTALPGFRTRDHTSWFTRMYNYITFKTTSHDTEDEDTSTNVTPGSIIACSPYRYVSPKWVKAEQASNTYMLINMRTNYGMNPPLTEIAHPNDLIPIN